MLFFHSRVYSVWKLMTTKSPGKNANNVTATRIRQGGRQYLIEKNTYVSNKNTYKMWRCNDRTTV